MLRYKKRISFYIIWPIAEFYLYKRLVVAAKELLLMGFEFSTEKMLVLGILDAYITLFASAISICGVAMGSIYEGLYVFFLTQIITIVYKIIVMKIEKPHITVIGISITSVSLNTLIFIVPNIAQSVFVICNYSLITYRIHHRYYKVIGSNLALIKSFKARNLVKAARIVGYYYIITNHLTALYFSVGDSCSDYSWYFYVPIYTSLLLTFVERSENTLIRVVVISLLLGGISSLIVSLCNPFGLDRR